MPHLYKGNLLVDNLGVADAIRFIVSFKRGKGDSAQKIRKCWGNEKIEDIDAEILEAKEKEINLSPRFG